MNRQTARPVTILSRATNTSDEFTDHSVPRSIRHLGTVCAVFHRLDGVVEASQFGDGGDQIDTVAFISVVPHRGPAAVSYHEKRGILPVEHRQISIMALVMHIKLLM